MEQEIIIKIYIFNIAETQILKDIFYPMGCNESLNASRDIKPLILIIMTNPNLLQIIISNLLKKKEVYLSNNT